MKGKKNKFKFYILSLAFICCCSLMSGCGNNTSQDAPLAVPGIPTGLNASDGLAANMISLEWKISEGSVLYYRVYRAPVINEVTGDYTLRKDYYYPELNNNGTTATFSDNKLSKSKIYSYRVAAVNEAGEGELSVPDTGHADALAPNLPLPPASGLMATNNMLHEIYIDWAPVAGISTYHLYRCDTPMGEYLKIGTITDLDAFEANGLFYAWCDNSTLPPWTGTVEGEAYYYRITSENSEGEGPMSDIINGWFPYDTPGTPPSSVDATDGTYSNKVKVTWSTVESATKYKIFRRVHPNQGTPTDGTCEDPATQAYDLIKTVNGTSYDNSDNEEIPAYSVVQGTYYCYTVKAENPAGVSLNFSTPNVGNSSSGGTASPANPTGVTATDIEIDQITVTWTRGDEIATDYIVYRSLEPLSGYTEVLDTAYNGTLTQNWTDTTIAADTIYYYKVKAVIKDGGGVIISESSLSNSDSGKAYPAQPAASVTVTATDGAYWNRINVTWDAIDRVESYTLYRKIGAGTWERLARDLTVTGYDDVSAELEALWGTPVTYRVYGINTNPDSSPDPENPPESALYAEDAGNVELGTPQNVIASDGGVWKINIQWDAVPEANYYILERQKNGESTWTEVDPGILKTGTSYQDAPGELLRFRYRVKSVRGYELDKYIGPPSASSGLVWCN